ncbi:AraC-type DNA-binding protein [Saccharicrinis carchari]|uniref:AraC-type DNA-binding protein n=1 Tax=Saccharicrinis carchari TaxID=1168039 RepID=A0A521BZB3_SACCC|nr:AraC family transcriptional regulator [Saccharicrinis carchari]SMO51810.1 AraC-type DNA-binding protein [Saccharicrinis carchari]
MKGLDKQSTKERFIIDLERLGFRSAKVIGKYNYREMKKGLEMHRHNDMLEIVFLDKGSQYYYIEGKDYHMTGGNILLTFPGEEHGTKGFPEEKGQLFWLIIHIPRNEQKLLNLRSIETKLLVDRLLQLNKNRLFKVPHGVKNDIEKIFQIYNNNENDVYKKIKITNLLLSFLLNIIAYGEKSSKITISDTFANICTFICDNIKEEISLTHLADKANLSLSHFKHRFKKEIGTTPMDFIMKNKINTAKIMLPEQKSVSGVAYELNFSSPSYFATVFKKYTSKNPSDYI